MENIKEATSLETPKENQGISGEKNLTADNTWNKEGLIRMRSNEDSEIVCCTATKKELFYYRKNGTKIMLASFGKCDDCELIFHEEYLHMADGVDHASWPIEYIHFYCNACWDKPISE